jgi:phosphatidylserine decarboxylase
MGWFSRIEQPWVRDLSFALWRFFADLDLSEAKRPNFRSVHDCFTRELKDGVRSIDPRPEILVSPCDAIIGASGTVADGSLYQIKGSRYIIEDLFADEGSAILYRNGRFVTLRLTSGMYHRFHAPHDCRVDRVAYIPGDAWNVNPATLRRVENVFCRNERAVLRTTLACGEHIVTLIPVAAVLVAGIRLRFVDLPLNSEQVMVCDARFHKGEEIGWFEHGSTILLFAPDGFTLLDNVEEGEEIRMGQALMRLP